MSVSDYLARHAQNAISALGMLSRQPVATALTVLVIGIALALPASLEILVRSAQSVAGTWKEVRDFSIYLKPGGTLEQAQQLSEALKRKPGIADVTVIPAERALAEFREDQTFGPVLNALTGNPLPHTLVVRPTADAPAGDLAGLRQEVSARPEVDLVQMDTEWLSRLNAILDFVRRALWLAAGLLVGAVVVIVGNTIRLDIQQRRHEIEVAKLLGATDAFVRRPFIYLGFWYGLIGGCIALLVVTAGLLALSGPLQRLASLYQANFDGFRVTGTLALGVVGGGLLAGCGGAWAAVGRHLSAIQPKV